jgi:hypothetical protein
MNPPTTNKWGHFKPTHRGQVKLTNSPITANTAFAAFSPYARPDSSGSAPDARPWRHTLARLCVPMTE